MRGRPAKQNSVNRAIRTTAMVLPSEGRKGDPPPWPLRPDMTLQGRIAALEDEQLKIELDIDGGTLDKRATNKAEWRLLQIAKDIAATHAQSDQCDEVEQEIWSELWALPQAVAWEHFRWTRQVAIYARVQAKAEAGNQAALHESRMLADRLGLTPLAMASLKWTIIEDEMSDKRSEQGTASNVEKRVKAVAV